MCCLQSKSLHALEVYLRDFPAVRPFADLLDTQRLAPLPDHGYLKRLLGCEPGGLPRTCASFPQQGKEGPIF